MASMRGQRWLDSAAYLTERDREKIAAGITEAREAGCERVGVRCASYIGEPSPIAVIIYGHGEAIWKAVYRDQ